MKHLCSIALILVLAGCYPQGPDYAEDTDVVYTVFEESYDFSKNSTYAMPDQIVIDVDVEDGQTIYSFMNEIFADPILASIEKNMTAMGYTRVSVGANPDLVLTPAALSSTTVFYSYWYDWWYGGYWGWYYPPYYSVSSYTTGTLMMVLSDPKAAEESPIGQSQAIWISAANGLADYSYDITRVTKSIDQSFAQSAYLNTK